MSGRQTSLLTDKEGLSNSYVLIICVERTSILFTCTFNRRIITVTRVLHDAKNESCGLGQLLH